MNAPVPRTVSCSGEALARMKAASSVPSEVLDSLRRQAAALLEEPTLTVLGRKQRAASGNPHDYASQGPYWWPDPNTPGGLPYIRRDGETNPESVDPVTPGRMAQRAWTLALAAWWFDDARFAAGARDTLYNWHLNPETYMTPHARYGQAIPGVCDGRGIGLIDFSQSYQVFDAAALLEALGGMPPAELQALRDWYVQFTDWMITSEIGLSEDVHPNNHGSYYDLQVLSAAVFTGREWLAKKICQTAYARRVAGHVEPDGSQPLELARTKAMSYSLYNLLALLRIAGIAGSLGYGEFWEADPRLGVCLLRQAGAFLLPYLDGDRPFPYQQITHERLHDSAALAFALLGARFPEEPFAAASARWQTPDMLWRAAPLM